MIMDVKKIIKDESGQAIFEMIVFFPFIILLFTLIVTVGNSINGSINQQKATRAYYYYSVAGSSMGAPTSDLSGLNGQGVAQVGFYAFGWKESDVGNIAVSTCYRMNKFLGSKSNEDCQNPEADEGSTDFIRVFTAYGVCTGSLISDNGQFYLDSAALGANSCSVR